jgi:hypothetical protein
MSKNKSTEEMNMRFIPDRFKSELINLYHTARIAGCISKYERMIWATKEFNKTYPEYSKGYIYKDLEEILC